MELPMRIDALPDPDTDGVYLRVAGELDLSTFAVLDEQHRIRTRECKPVRIDLGEVTFIDSSGLGCLILARRRADDHGVRLAIHPVSDVVRAAARLTGIEGWLDGGPEGPVIRLRT